MIGKIRFNSFDFYFLNLIRYERSDRESNINYPVSYLPHTSFCFKMLSLKIKEK